MTPASKKRRNDLPPHSCSGCSSRWHGFNRAHCSACHRTFNSVSPFDEHRPGRCIDPTTRGMVLRKGIWYGRGTYRPLSGRYARVHRPPETV